MKFGLTEETLEKIYSTFQSFPQVSKVVIYGSRAKGNYRPGSDIDLALMGEGINLQLVNQIRSKLDDLLLPYMFDLSVYEQITDNEVTDYIQRIGQVFYSARDGQKNAQSAPGFKQSK